jgi:hypothetical protein
MSEPASTVSEQTFVIFLLQERVSQHVPTFVGGDLLWYLNNFCNLSAAGAGFSTCTNPCLSPFPTVYEHTFVIFLLQERVSQHVPTLV